MDRNLCYNITVKPEDKLNCMTLLYGSEEQDALDESFWKEEELLQDNQFRSFYGGIGLLFAVSLAIVLLLML